MACVPRRADADIVPPHRRLSSRARARCHARKRCVVLCATLRSDVLCALCVWRFVLTDGGPFCLLQFNFVGRILGPRGMTAKQLEQETGCKIMVRGRGSMRDKKKVSTALALLSGYANASLMKRLR